ncbi:hypothetical protein GYMLUDRAFT_688687 [Collybiopsis luxurians FD-317 M1]|uniref:Uncharacterized protein n=1 Tax=Collybiopsis luxurians FD-317 M1 TaxID=944289 RepID=A0A0D0BU91_9AGAR|nr:hypothetical protein GYMLUDRAFT_688687 [Collybiopsis luxurians FD-317 M1]
MWRWTRFELDLEMRTMLMANKQDPFRSQNLGFGMSPFSLAYYKSHLGMLLVMRLSSRSCSIDHIARRTKNPSEYRCIALKFSQASSVRFSPIAFKGSSLSLTHIASHSARRSDLSHSAGHTLGCLARYSSNSTLVGPIVKWTEYKNEESGCNLTSKVE